jgi:hypothetical protein
MRLEGLVQIFFEKLYMTKKSNHLNVALKRGRFFTNKKNKRRCCDSSVFFPQDLGSLASNKETATEQQREDGVLLWI